MLIWFLKRCFHEKLETGTLNLVAVGTWSPDASHMIRMLPSNKWVEAHTFCIDLTLEYILAVRISVCILDYTLIGSYVFILVPFFFFLD